MLDQQSYRTFAAWAAMKFATVILILSVPFMGQSKPRTNTPALSDDFAKAAIKYVVAAQNFEVNGYHCHCRIGREQNRIRKRGNGGGRNELWL